MDAHFIGFIGAFLTTISFIPQAWKAVKTRNTSGVSLPMYLIFSVGVAVWLVYGILLESPPIIAANIITLALSLIILGCKLKNRD